MVGLHFVLSGGTGDRDRQRAAGIDATQSGFAVADFGDVLGIAGVVRRGVQDTTGE